MKYLRAFLFCYFSFFIFEGEAQIIMKKEGGRASGGGETKINPEFLKIARSLSDSLNEVNNKNPSLKYNQYADKIDALLNHGLMVIPKNEPLVLSDQLGTDGILVDGLTEIGGFKTEIFAPNWIRLSCEKKYLLTLHELFVHEKIEKSLTMNISQPIIDNLFTDKNRDNLMKNCEEPRLGSSSNYVISQIVNNELGLISLECIGFDDKNHCSTMQFFYSPAQQDIKKPIGGKIYHAQEISKLSVVDWNNQKWNKIPNFYLENFQISTAILSGGFGLTLGYKFLGFEKIKDKIASKKAENILNLFKESIYHEEYDSNGIHLSKNYISKKSAFNMLILYLSNEGSIDAEFARSLNQGLRFTHNENINKVCIDPIDYIDSKVVLDDFAKRGQKEICALLISFDDESFSIIKPQVESDDILDSLNGFAIKNVSEEELCTLFSKKLNVSTNKFKTTSVTTAISSHDHVLPFEIKNNKVDGFYQSTGVFSDHKRIGNYRDVIHSLNCYNR